MELLNALLPLLGVLIGAAATYMVTMSAEDRRWRRTHSVRWDERRLTAYIEFGESSKQIMSIGHRVAAARGIDATSEPIDIEDGLSQLAAATAARQSKWEAVLLLGAAEAVDAARAWHRAVWKPIAYARGAACDQVTWLAAVDEVDVARDAFYDAARRDLGVPPFSPSPHLRQPNE